MTKIQGVPIGIIAGTNDMLSTLEDTRWVSELLREDTLVHYSEHELGHLSYFTAKDMSFFEVNVMDLFKKYHPIKAA